MNSTEDVGDAHILSVDSPIESWIVDSGASFHSSPSKELFHNFVGRKFGKVHPADNKSLEILGRGNVNVKVLNGGLWKLQDVRYIPGLTKNLISISQLDSIDYKTEFGNGSWKMVKGALVVARGMKSGTSYTTGGCTNLVANVAESSCSTSLWHSRLGHMSEKGLKITAVRGSLPGLKSVDMGLCESCVFGKQK